MLDAGIIRPSTFSFPSLITIEPKVKGTVGLCTNFCVVNRQRDLFSFAMPRIYEVLRTQAAANTFLELTFRKVVVNSHFRKSTRILLHSCLLLMSAS